MGDDEPSEQAQRDEPGAHRGDELRGRTRALCQVLLAKNPTVLRGAKVATKRCRSLDWDSSADYLYAKIAEALHLGGAANRERAMKGFLDDKHYRPGLETFEAEPPAPKR